MNETQQLGARLTAHAFGLGATSQKLDPAAAKSVLTADQPKKGAARRPTAEIKAATGCSCTRRKGA
jgi:hypothetical protein